MSAAFSENKRLDLKGLEAWERHLRSFAELNDQKTRIAHIVEDPKQLENIQNVYKKYLEDSNNFCSQAQQLLNIPFPCIGDLRQMSNIEEIWHQQQRGVHEHFMRAIREDKPLYSYISTQS